AVLGAVREVPGVRSASVRPNPNGVHTLRLDLADDADPGQVSRLVARLLEERMGLSAAPNDAPGDLPGGQVPPWSARAAAAPASAPPAAAAPASAAPAATVPASAAPARESSPPPPGPSPDARGEAAGRREPPP